ncbi:MAG: hypothetical protein ACXV3F_00825 [Frankiaceae bacterium]
MSEGPGRRRARAPDGADDDATERREGGLSSLIGAGRSRVGVGGAMRARDVSRPSKEDMAAAEREVVVKRSRPDVPPR